MAGRGLRSQAGKQRAVLAVRLTPRASRDQIVDVLADGTVKIRVSAPPVDGQANRALIEFLAEVLGVAKSRITVASGASGRNKLVSVSNMEVEEARRRIAQYLR
jgi:uncharacterized protein (TIGR00251 family)